MISKRGVRDALRRVFSPRGLNSLQKRKAQEHNCANRDPVSGYMQDHGAIDQAANQYQEAENVDAK
jgi:hypothetical protein